MKILNNYKNINDLKKLNKDELNILANEIREYLISLSNKKEIHLSSNLGIVELTIAVLLEFDLLKDKVLYDTGHQTYVHKMLTDRLDRIDTIRDTNGIAGLMDMNESIYDHYSPGHSGNIISVLDGMYSKVKFTNKHKTKKQYFNKNYHVCIVGDSAINNGISLEALNDVAYSQDPLIIIINDNGMGISRSVGNISKLINGIKLTKNFFNIEKFFRKILKFSKSYYSLEKIYNILESVFKDKNIFENLNFKYIGPVDGNDINKLRLALEKAKWYSHQGPIIVHVKTLKGKGEPNAENDKIGEYHSKILQNKKTFGYVAYLNLSKKLENDNNIRILNPAMNIGSGFNEMLINNVEQYEDTGITEGHTISKASGMALAKLNVYCLFYSTFLQRSYDQLLHDCSRLNLNIKILLDRSDISGGDGSSHHGIFDVGYLKTIPNTEIMSPRNFEQLNYLIDYTYNNPSNKIQVIRYPKTVFVSNSKPFELNHQFQDFEWMIDNNNKILILSYGPYVDRIYNLIIQNNLNVDLVNIIWITNYNSKQLANIFEKYPYILVYERIYGDFGIFHDLIKYKSQYNLNNEIKLMSFNNFVGNGKNDDLDKLNNMDETTIIKAIKEF